MKINDTDNNFMIFLITLNSFIYHSTIYAEILFLKIFLKAVALQPV